MKWIDDLSEVDLNELEELLQEYKLDEDNNTEK
jgi:hypothetical protein